MTKKVANYSASDIEQLKAGYNGESLQAERKLQVTALAGAMKRKEASIIAKLVNLDLYVKNETLAKDGSKSVSKAERVSAIAKELGMNEELFDSFVKSNVSVVKLFAGVVTRMNLAEKNLEAVLDSVEAVFVDTESGEAE
jgi:hypothetical protein